MWLVKAKIFFCKSKSWPLKLHSKIVLGKSILFFAISNTTNLFVLFVLKIHLCTWPIVKFHLCIVSTQKLYLKLYIWLTSKFYEYYILLLGNPAGLKQLRSIPRTWGLVEVINLQYWGSFITHYYNWIRKNHSY